MFSALLLGAVLSGQPADVSVVDHLGKFCVETEMRKEAFEQVAENQKLERLLRVVRSTDDIDPNEWESMFGNRQARNLQVMMTGTSADSAVATYCAVMVPTPEDDWRASLQRLADSMNLREAEQVASDDVREAGRWAPDNGSGSSLVYKLYSSALVVSLERPDPPQP